MFFVNHAADIAIKTTHTLHRRGDGGFILTSQCDRNSTEYLLLCLVSLSGLMLLM